MTVARNTPVSPPPDDGEVAPAAQLFRLAFQHAAIGMVVIDHEGTFLRVNAAACGIFGYAEEELLGTTLQALTDPADLEIGADLFADLRSGQREAGSLERRHVRRDGKVIWTLLSAAAIRDGEGRFLDLVVQIQDITARKEREALLASRVAARTRALEALYDVTAVAGASLDLDTVLSASLDRVLAVMGCAVGGIHLIAEDAGVVRLMVWRGIPEAVHAEIRRLSPGEGVVGRIVEADAPMVVPALGAAPDAMPATRRLMHDKVYVGAPMHAQGEVVGVLAVMGDPGRQFTVEEVALLASIADQVGVAVQNVRLYRRAEALAIVEERQRLARELHDSVTQSLYSARLLAEAARRAADARHAPGLSEVRAYMDELNEITRQALKEMRLLVHELRPPALAKAGLVGALQQRIDAVEGRAGVQARLLVTGDVAPPADVGAALYGIGQEALNNALKHAAADEVTLRLNGWGDHIELVVEDTGCGFDPDAVRGRGGMGLSTMAERAAAVGGELSVQSELGVGTRVRVTVPASGPVSCDGEAV